MKGAVIIWKKEARTYATGARWYVIAAMMFGILSFGFYVMNLWSESPRQATLANISGWLSSLILFGTPILTMRLISEEASRGTLEMLLTSPVRDWEVVIGKYLGAMTAYFALFVVMLIYPAILFRFGDPDPWTMLSQYLGMIALASAFVSVGLFASSVTDSQILAAVLAFMINIFLVIAHVLTAVLPASLEDVGEALSVFSHLNNFNKGVLDSVDVFYYVAFTGVFLFLSVRFVEARRWAA